MEKKKVDAVHDDDLLDLLESLELKNKFLYGKLTCSFCGDVITWDNLHSLFPDSGTIKCCCTKSDCVNQLIAKFRQS
jgi:hypothetical protein